MGDPGGAEEEKGETLSRKEVWLATGKEKLCREPLPPNVFM